MKVFRCHDDGTSTVSEIPDPLPNETPLEWMNRMGLRERRIQRVQTFSSELEVQAINCEGYFQPFVLEEPVALKADEQCMIELPTSLNFSIPPEIKKQLFGKQLDSPPPG